MMAKVYKADVDFSAGKHDVTVTFHVNEGEQFRIRTIAVQSDDLISEEKLVPLVTLKEGEPFSQTDLVNSINRLKDIWGEKGYIFADVYPHIKPDEEAKLVDITFMTERGSKLYVNRIDVTGNVITRDKIIRRQFDIYEGDLITTKRLRDSKNAVEYLSFFEREGVNWKVHRISSEKANLEMNVKEAKTGSFNFQVTYGSDRNNPKPSLRGQLTLEKANLFGRGWDVGGLIQASRHRIKKLEARFFEPYLFDSNVSMGVFAYKRWDEYDQWKNQLATPIQSVTGGNVRFGFRLTPIDKRTQVSIDLGVEDIKTRNKKDLFITGIGSELFNPVINRTFQDGTMNWISVDLIRDTRNHQVYPNKGHKIILATKTVLPGLNKQFSFFKAELGLSWYQALMGVDTLVLGTQFKAGIIRKIGSSINTLIPYKELFHMGGQNTVRGFVWGGIEPAWKATGDPLGAQNMLQFNAELIFPLIPDYSMKGHVFYDAGAGWDTPKDRISNSSLIKRDKFNVRHSVGFGVNLVKPFPAKIDWGFKLDRRKHDGESPHEFHLSMNYAF
jgi:outer membrane protein insertion porin family